MSVSIEEILNASGYDPINDTSDAEWLLGQKDDFAELLEKATDLLDEEYRKEYQDEYDG